MELDRIDVYFANRHSQANSLNIGTKLFEELLKNYSHSMDRKKVELTFFKEYYTPKEKPPAPQRTWLRNI